MVCWVETLPEREGEVAPALTETIMSDAVMTETETTMISTEAADEVVVAAGDLSEDEEATEEIMFLEDEPSHTLPRVGTSSRRMRSEDEVEAEPE